MAEMKIFPMDIEEVRRVMRKYAPHDGSVLALKHACALVECHSYADAVRFTDLAAELLIEENASAAESNTG
jgi:hypothetical protein